MSVLNVVKYPNELLHQKSEKVEVFDKKLTKLIGDMFDTMSAFNGIGLAAVQIGVLKQIIVIDIDYEGQVFKSEIINPKIISFSPEQTIMTEGCLSVVDRRCDVMRPKEVEVEYYTIDRQKHTIKVDGLLAKCFQHEIDHLNGVVILDREVKNNNINNQ